MSKRIDHAILHFPFKINIWSSAIELQYLDVFRKRYLVIVILAPKD